MVGCDFMYNGKYLSELNFIMAKPDEEDDFGLMKTIVKGSTNTHRNTAIHMGSYYENVLTLHFFLIKDVINDKKNTKIDFYELRNLQNWLTSPKLPQSLYLETFDHKFIEYIGLFTEVTAKEYNGLNGLALVFTCNSPYAYEEASFVAKDGSKVYFDCETDELDEYLYPKITITTYPLSEGIVTIANEQTGDSMTVDASEYNEVVIDCKLQRILGDGNPLTFDDIGWSEEIQLSIMQNGLVRPPWLRLQSGVNTLTFSGEAKYKVSCKVPMKLGGYPNV